eukprot:TRINITY_DN4618_c0_g2_i1.p1 TRINITY_DN4618_c0_g2~~TRINITY_DN4618_c0_g2_i1.p1  ORF type:complete len:495 (-),score=81.62 TRINITY_DN4618_c0_g2_i1:13-1497(-)
MRYRASAAAKAAAESAGRAFKLAVDGAIADSKLLRVRPLLEGLVHLPCASLAEAQGLADLIGCAATNYSESGWSAESSALRGISREVLEGMLENGPDALPTSSGCQVLEQLMVRSAERGGGRENIAGHRRAAELAAQGESLATKLKNPHAFGRFNAARRFFDEQTMAMEVRSVSSTSPCNSVDKHSVLSPDDFAERYSKQSKPVVVKSPSCLPAGWGFKQLAELCGKRQINIEQYDPSSSEWASMKCQGESTLRNLLQGWKEQNNKGVVFDESLAEVCPALLNIWRWSPCLEASDLLQHFEGSGIPGSDPFHAHPSLFVQPAGSQCGVHVDAFRSQFAQAVIRGRKRWVLWDLDVADQVRFMGRRDKVRLEVQKGRRMQRKIHFETVFDGSSDEAGLVEGCEDQQIARDDLLEKSRMEVEVGEGETIFVPGGMPHQVFNLEDTIAISQNFIDAIHAPRSLAELRWPVPYDDVADFLEGELAKRGVSAVRPRTAA